MDARKDLIASALQILESSDEEANFPFLYDNNDDSLDCIEFIAQAIQPVLDCIQVSEHQTTVDNLKNLIGECTEEDFIKDFRLSREVTCELIFKFNTSEIYQSLLGNAGRAPLSAEKHILSFLWFVGHETTGHLGVSERFKITFSTVHSVISRVSDFLIIIAPDVIRYPTLEEKIITKQHFLQTKRIPGVIGVIHTTHIRINRRSKEKNSYTNKSKSFSIQIQGVANHEQKFIDIFVGYPGSVCGAKVFHESFLHDNLHLLCKGDECLVGDRIFPCTQHLMVPFKNNGHLTAEQIKFNALLNSCQDNIKEAFGNLKLRFPLLYHCKFKGTDRIVKVIHACCVLHNLANAKDMELFGQQSTEEPFENDVGSICNTHFDDIHQDNLRGCEMRDEIYQQLSTHS